ncbi:HdeA family protein [Microbacteriaceae bacterium K1510]|nr:HdeA family protein [Microbacteriaceae bacterium K1510]
MLRRSLTAAALVIALSAAAQAQSNFPCDAFIKNADGSWTAGRNVRLPGPGTSYGVNQGATFTPNMSIMGMNVVSELEQQCPANLVPAAQTAVDVAKYADAKGEIDAQTLTCAQLADASQEDAEFLGVWYVGWYSGQAKKTAINIAAAKAAIPELIVYCKANKNRTVALAIDAVLKKAAR